MDPRPGQDPVHAAVDQFSTLTSKVAATARGSILGFQVPIRNPQFSQAQFVNARARQTGTKALILSHRGHGAHVAPVPSALHSPRPSNNCFPMQLLLHPHPHPKSDATQRLTLTLTPSYSSSSSTQHEQANLFYTGMVGKTKDVHPKRPPRPPERKALQLSQQKEREEALLLRHAPLPLPLRPRPVTLCRKL